MRAVVRKRSHCVVGGQAEVDEKGWPAILLDARIATVFVESWTFLGLVNFLRQAKRRVKVTDGYRMFCR